MMRIKIFFVDDSMREYEEKDPSFPKRLKKLHESGYKGKELINNLISDDWPALPRTVRIIGSDSSEVRLILKSNINKTDDW